MSMPDFAWSKAEVTAADAGDDQARFAAAVRAGLRLRPQRQLPSEYFYDAVGTALFEAITYLPEYGLTRADTRLLAAHAEAVLDLLPAPLSVAELGSGSARKTLPLLAALARRQPVRYFPIDVSAAALARCRAELAGVVAEFRPESADYLDGLRRVAAARKTGEHLLVLFVGSTIGNFDRPAAARFLAALQRELRPDDALLLGADGEHRPLRLLAAYDDPAGVTAAFNLNLLARINRELAGQIPLEAFLHQARFDPHERRVEMHLCARRAVRLEIPAADVSDELRPGDTIWTESSYKYRPEEVRAMAATAGFACLEQWLDRDWPFTESLLLA